MVSANSVRPCGLVCERCERGGATRLKEKTMVDVAAVRINVRYQKFIGQNGREPNDAEVLEIARWAWWGIRRYPLVFACVDGKVKGVYKVDKWFRCGEARMSPEFRPCTPEGSVRWNEIEKDINDDRRHAFIGHRAACADQFIGKPAPAFNPRNPVTWTQVNIKSSVENL